VIYLTLQSTSRLPCSFNHRLRTIVRSLTHKYPALRKWLVLVGTILLIGLTITPFAWDTTLGNHERAVTMGRGGQFEKAILW